ncbi:exo-beta-N-acetylmuramidase NamZ family protein [Allokutzneria oryzae]|uniref:Exo-beta-N-acetylmuramidase NamZ domain-containing protein n=1 Tax=Allokutzneria oryzae TaxID=1378989 RepID=A0ABV6A2V4_9PSEU
MDGLNRRRFLTASALAAPALGIGVGTAAAQPEAEAFGGHRRVLTGADQLAAGDWRMLAGKKVGVVTNPTGVLSDMRHIVDAMADSKKVNVVGIFGPEHGFRGTAQAGGSEGEFDDPRTGLRVYDAYGINAAKLAELYKKAGVDTVVFDICDAGVRFYTYIWMLYTAMHAAVLATNVSVIVLDRPNPIGGQAYGPQLDPKHSSGVGRKPIAMRHGMTMGELARLYNDTFLPQETGSRVAKLDVVEVRGWRRDTLFDDTGLLWIPPSPNVPTPETVLAYPGTCLFEGTLWSEGRGTTRPFEIIGAPKVDWRWAEKLNGYRMPGVTFRETYFQPTFNKHVGVNCGGVQLMITDPRRFDPIRAGVAMLVEAKRLYPGLFAWRTDNFIAKLWGTDRLKDMIERGAGVDEIVGSYQAEQAEFRKHRAPYLLYR